MSCWFRHSVHLWRNVRIGRNGVRELILVKERDIVKIPKGEKKEAHIPSSQYSLAISTRQLSSCSLPP